MLSELVVLVKWIQSDGRLLTDDEIVGEMKRDLGFRRLGNRIESAIRRAVTIARAN